MPVPYLRHRRRRVLRLHARDDVELGKAADIGGVGTLACRIAASPIACTCTCHPRSLAMSACRASLSPGHSGAPRSSASPSYGSSIDAVFDSTTPSAKALTIPLLIHMSLARARAT